MPKGIYKRTKEIYKKTEEHKLKLSKAMTGQNHPNWGKHRSEETKIKISKSHIGKHPSNETKRKMSDRMKGTHHSIETKRKMSEAHRGLKSYQWKGGITPIVQLIRRSSKYQQWRTNCFMRDKFICQKCGYAGKKLEVHHKKPFYRFLSEIKKYLPLFGLYEGALLYNPLWNLDNGITLCKRCHCLRRKNAL